MRKILSIAAGVSDFDFACFSAPAHALSIAQSRAELDSERVDYHDKPRTP